MDKYGVDTDKGKDKVATDQQACPVCGATLLTDTYASICPKCGSKPFEKRPNKENERNE